MRNIFDEVERKKRAIWLVALLLIIYNSIRLLSIIASPYPIDQIIDKGARISISEYQEAFQIYSNNESERLQMPPDSFKIAILYSGFLAAGYIIFSFFLGMRKKFARYSGTSVFLPSQNQRRKSRHNHRLKSSHR